ncbi:hypothetical protein HOLleu_41137 [Holothuria leucospilota]|uniref:Uncharacterized protein n=1 Tax=Holothuria leucospilota TaxID=206669 RepID=A0A9Q0YD85_HOLLE|nr:hypothetical protein HOLleu_41137 [Holothuria leucospilota]
MPFSADHCVKGQTYFVKRVTRSEPAPRTNLEMPGYYVGNSLAEQLLDQYQSRRYTSLENLHNAPEVPISNELHQRAQTLGVVSPQESAAIGGHGGLRPTQTVAIAEDTQCENGEVTTPRKSNLPPIRLPVLTQRNVIERSIPLRRKDPTHDITLPQCLITSNGLAGKGRLPRNSTAFARERVRKTFKELYPPKAIFSEKRPRPVNFYTTNFPHVVLEENLRRQQGIFLNEKMNSIKFSKGIPFELESKNGFRHNYSQRRPELAPLEKLVNHSALMRVSQPMMISDWWEGLHCHPKQIHAKESEVPPNK